MSLLQIQDELKAPKSQYNSFGKYHYRSTEDILSAVKPLLKKCGDDMIISDEPVLIGDWHYIKATVTFKDKDGNTTVATGYAREATNKRGMDESQITGTASSYARKYALNGLFLIDDTKDPDSKEYQQQNQSRQSQKNYYQQSRASGRQTQQQYSQQTPNQNQVKQAITSELKAQYQQAIAEYAVLTKVTTSEANKKVGAALKVDKSYMALKDENAKINKATNVVKIMIQQIKNGGNKQ